MQSTDDLELLRDYAIRGSEKAFETLVQRYVNLVYSAALRRVRDPVLAGEVTQTVFIVLAEKAPSLRPATILSGWLYRTAQLAAGHALRAASRRRKHEEEAAPMLHQEPEPPDATWRQIAPILEEAMARLGEADCPGHVFIRALPILNLVGYIHQYFSLPVIDQTGLTGNYSLDLNWDAPAAGQPAVLQPFNEALIDQLGLELTSEIRPVVGGLVIEKAR